MTPGVRPWYDHEQVECVPVVNRLVVGCVGTACRWVRKASVCDKVLWATVVVFTQQHFQAKIKTFLTVWPFVCNSMMKTRR